MKKPVDPVVEWLKKNNQEVTRQNYLNVAYLGAPPEELSAEEEAELPEELQSKSIEPGQS